MNALSRALPALSTMLVLSTAACGQGYDPGDASSSPELESSMHEIRGGDRDDGHAPVALLYDDGQGGMCSGTLISDRVYLTAAHCIGSTNPNDYIIIGGTDPFENHEWFADVDEVHRHPQYDDQNLIHDVGIVVLSEDAPVGSYRWVEDDDDEEVYAEGEGITLVGYGQTSESAWNSSGIKRTADVDIEEVYQDVIVYGGPTTNVCSGDSGGPALKKVGGRIRVVGVTSFGDQNCSQFGASMRTDDNANFIDNFAGPDEGTSGRVGGGGGGGSGCSVAHDGSRASGFGLVPAFLAIAGLAATTRRRARES